MIDDLSQIKKECFDQIRVLTGNDKKQKTRLADYEMTIKDQERVRLQSINSAQDEARMLEARLHAAEAQLADRDRELADMREKVKIEGRYASETISLQRRQASECHILQADLEKTHAVNKRLAAMLDSKVTKLSQIDVMMDALRNNNY